MGRSEELDPRWQADAEQLGIGELALELLPPLQAVRQGMVLVSRDAPRALEVIEKIDATLRAMEGIVDELLDVGRSGRLLLQEGTGLAEICRSVITDASI